MGQVCREDGELYKQVKQNLNTERTTQTSGLKKKKNTTKKEEIKKQNYKQEKGRMKGTKKERKK